jgi:hypothetical protein
MADASILTSFNLGHCADILRIAAALPRSDLRRWQCRVGQVECIDANFARDVLVSHQLRTREY